MVGVEVVNGLAVQERLQAIARRAADPGPGLAPVLELMQRDEAGVFDSYDGKYVQSGALRASLTEAGSGAIRKLTPWGIEFGSSVPYARFQGTEGPGNHSGPSAILKLTPEERVLVPMAAGHYIMHGERL